MIPVNDQSLFIDRSGLTVTGTGSIRVIKLKEVGKHSTPQFIYFMRIDLFQMSIIFNMLS